MLAPSLRAVPRLALLALSALLLSAGCDADEVAKQCVAADLIGQCPVGSNPVLGAAANEGCGGSFDGQLVSEDVAITGQCNASGSCEFLCQFAVPCSCGVATITRDAIVCSECPDQSCGDSRCEGTERASCEAGQVGCLACAEDCAGPSCGDGDCSGGESPANCPQDCERECAPSTKDCLGSNARVCKADGSAWDSFDCANIGLICGGGECVVANVCGNAVCDEDETPSSCASDCSTLCSPSSTRCGGNTMYTCNANGSAEAAVDCAVDGLVCAGGECKPGDVCGNQLCEAGEDDVSCAADCAAECGNHICENGETNSCPGDCVVCGDDVCGANELATCPQDCGICLPSAKDCLGRLLRVCNANGTAFDDVDCTAFDQICASGDCVDPDICGNGACELGEDETSCASDCATICGDTTCEGTESFATCSEDCAPVCGDDACQGDETRASCAADCLASCGNGVCDGGEDRETCQGDCGFCGDGTCDDGFESANLSPPNGQTSCLVDCVVSGCTKDGDCNDGVACTPGKCVDEVCQYTADDSLCPFEDKCIKFHGCCADADQDGFADVACGGSDCNDDEPLTYPGAVEVCGGGDRNCNGVHRPALKPAKKVTNTAAYKTRLAMVWDGARFWATWLGVPEATQVVQFARVGRDGNLVGSVGQLPDGVADIQPGIAWNAVAGHIGIAYGISNLARFATIAATGIPTGDLYPDLDGTAGNQPPLEIHASVLDGHYIVSTYGGINCGPAGNTRCHTGWYDISEELTVNQPWGQVPAAIDFVPLGDQMIGLSPHFAPNENRGTLHKVRLGEDTYVSVDIVPPSADGTCQLDFDGEGLVLVCQYVGTIGNQSDGGKLYYHRLASNGAALSTSIVGPSTAQPRDIAIAPDGLAGNDSAKIAVVAQEASGNLVFFVRDLDGSAVVEPGLIAGGTSVSDPHVFWDGDGFQVFWLEKSGDIQQLYRSQISCE